MDFAKLHALGNDFLVMRVDEAGALGMSLSRLAEKACHRHRGVGADGVLFFQPTVGDPQADFSCLIFNLDGSKAEMSGNGVRCLATYLAWAGLATSPTIRIRTVAGIKTCVLKGRRESVYEFETAMGLPITDPRLIPSLFSAGAEPIVDYPLEAGGETVPVTVLSMGNPHCSTFWPDVDQAPVDRLGPLLERHSMFPRRTNTEFVQVLDDHCIRARFWERGAGRTLSSGTGSCAAAVAAIFRKAASSPVRVETEGGTLQIVWQPPDDVKLTGTAEVICAGRLSGTHDSEETS